MRSRDFAQAKSESDSRRGRTSGAAERQRDVADIEAAETPGGGTAGAGLPLKGAVCGSRLGLKSALAQQAQGPGDTPRTRTPPNGLTKKCSSEHRRGRGTLPRQSREATPGGDARRGRAAASCRRQRSSGDARRRHRRSPRTRTPPNGLTKKCSSEHRRGRGTLQCKVGKRLERRRGSGTRPVSIVTGLRWRACAASAGVRGYALHKDTAEWLD